ncbi:MAG: hypothetical protein IKF18_06785 [Erysipelotrichaceae bacterium]|nr:hypothetical protein [Erysipelotrichaceae bacterium]
MRVIKKILNWLGLICLLGGLGLIVFAYFSNRSFLNYISNLLADAKFGVTLRQMLFGVLLIIISLVLFSLALKAGGVAKRHEREKEEALRVQREEEEARTRKLQQEAEQAKAEAERVKAEAQQIIDNRDNVVAATKETTPPEV